MLPRSWQLTLVDLDRERLCDEAITAADYVFVSAMIVHRESVQEVAERCRALGTPVIAGGPLFTTDHEDFPQIQHFVLGEAEELMADVVRDLEAGMLRHVYEAPAFPDVETTPIPRWDLVDLDAYASMAVQYSRGCPFDCEFCDIVVMNGRIPRTKRPAQVIAELEALRRLGWESSVFLVDDNFIGNRPKVKDLLRAMIDWRERVAPAMTFTTEASINLADDAELLDLMVRAGFDRVFLGIETPELDSLQECRKMQNTRRDMTESIRVIQNAGLEVLGGFIVGFDADTPDIFKRQFEFIQKAGVVTAMVGLLTALPKTKLYHRLHREGRLLKKSSGNNTEAFCNFVPRLDRDLLLEGYRSLMKRLYEPRAYYERARAFLAEYKTSSKPRFPRRAEILAAIRSVWVLGIVRRGRRQYWRFLGHVLLHHRPALGSAIAITIYGHHFRMVAEKL